MLYTLLGRGSAKKQIKGTLQCCCSNHRNYPKNPNQKHNPYIRAKHASHSGDGTVCAWGIDAERDEIVDECSGGSRL
uniref:Uncharacterized protein n=1 Tax=Megaselia scalaris TaxID=36166 RepID=T1H192_MEGSC